MKSSQKLFLNLNSHETSSSVQRHPFPWTNLSVYCVSDTVLGTENRDEQIRQGPCPQEVYILWVVGDEIAWDKVVGSCMKKLFFLFAQRMLWTLMDEENET